MVSRTLTLAGFRPAILSLLEFSVLGCFASWSQCQSVFMAGRREMGSPGFIGAFYQGSRSFPTKCPKWTFSYVSLARTGISQSPLAGREAEIGSKEVVPECNEHQNPWRVGQNTDCWAFPPRQSDSVGLEPGSELYCQYVPR